MNETDLQRGLDAMANNDSHEAVEVFTRLIADQPRAHWAYYHRARAWLQRGNRPKAIADFDAAIKIVPKNVDYLYARAVEHLKQRQYAKACADCNAVVQLTHDRADVLALRGQCQAALGNTVEALADYDRAMAADASLAPGVQRLKDRLLHELGQFKEAEKESPV